jgi:succinate-acetate transporter protein
MARHQTLSPGPSNILGSEDDATRMVVVRYYLDRPGMDLQHSSARLWRNPPSLCSGADVGNFLKQQGIMGDQGRLLVEVYLHDFMSFMLLEACQEDGVKFDFSCATVKKPGILNVRLTDTVDWTGNDHNHSQPQSNQSMNQNCSTTPPGLFGFTLNVAMEATSLLPTLVPGTVNESFVLLWGPYTFFVSGLLLLISGMFSVTRNNIYGATAFMTFGCFGLANGSRLILANYFPDAIPPTLSASDPVGSFIRNIFIFGFGCALLKQTFHLKRFTTLMISLLCVTGFARSLAGWGSTFQWIHMIFGFLTSFVSWRNLPTRCTIVKSLICIHGKRKVLKKHLVPLDV